MNAETTERKRKTTLPKFFIKKKSPKSSPAGSPRSQASSHDDIDVDLSGMADEDVDNETINTPPTPEPKCSSPQRKTQSSPQDKDENNRHEKEMLQFIELVNALSNQNGSVPPKLESLEQEAVEQFFEEYLSYEGKDKGKISKFIEPFLLESLKEFEIGNVRATDSDILHYLRQHTKPKTVDDIINALEAKVGISSNATTTRNKLLSLVMSMRKTVDQLGLKEVAATDASFILPFKRKKELLLSKLPRDFQHDFEKYSSYRKEAENLQELYNQLTAVGEKYAGSWDDAVQTEFTPYEDSPMYKDAQKKHSKAVRSLRSNK